MKYVSVDEPDYEEILPLAEAKGQVRAVNTHEDGALEEIRNWAVDEIERYAKRPMSNRSFRLTLDGFPSVVRFPVAPVTAVTEVSYFNAANEEVVLAGADWVLGGDELAAAAVWPATNRHPGNVVITFTAGEPSNILKMAARAAFAAMYENRSSPDLTAAHAIASRVRTPTIA